MANDLTFNQLSTVLNDIVSQATGVTGVKPVNTSQFVTVGQTALKMGYDPLINSISQVLTRTIFSIRPYTAKFRGMMVDSQKFGAITRKLQISDKAWEDDQRFELVEGESVDMFKVSKPVVLQTNFYGQNIFQRHYTIFKDQLDTAFRSPDEFGRFLSMVTQNCSDIIEQAHESMKRATLGNFIGGKYVGDPDSVIHLLTEYNNLTGAALTPSTVFSPENFKAFVQWLAARIQQISHMLTERTLMWHTNITGKPVMRHTPYNRQRLYLYAPIMAMVDTMALSDIFHDKYIKFSDSENVNFWQSAEQPDALEVAPVYLQNDGTLMEAAATNIPNLLGVIMDEESCGITSVNQWSAPTPFNAAGGYTNIFFHFTDRYWNDFTENGVVLMLD